MTPHNEAKKGDIAKTVIMPGDPLRAKYIAEKFLDNYKLVNSIRNIYAYTGKYKGKNITIMAHGMGMPSIGIYSYELYKFYDVDTIIRIGSCGGYSKDLKLFDIILSEKSYTEGNYAFTLDNNDCHIAESTNEINNLIEKTSKEINIPIVKGNTVCSDAFDLYMTDVNQFLSRIPENLKPIGCEMEAFALFYNAKILNKKASCLMSVVDITIDGVEPQNATTEAREKGLVNMITLALESSLKI